MAKHIAHIIIEAETPLKVGSNKSDFLQDAPIQRDWNNLPMILGTSIAGALRKDFDKGLANEVFGHEDTKNKDAKGSQIIVSNALLLDENGKVYEELLLQKTPFLEIFDNLPIREHVKISDKGVVDGSGKFDEEVVYKGTRFKFSIELIEDNKEVFEQILNQLSSPSFRLGGGSTKGFGKFEVIDIKTTSKECSSSLNDDFKDEGNYKKSKVNTDYIAYTLQIKPDDFFMFGSGFGDEDADMTPVYEKVVNYESGNLDTEEILIPASSIKGALAHRTAFHYNKMMLAQNKEHTKVSEENRAVLEIFGHKKELADDKKTELGKKGKILISDCFMPKNEAKEKVFDHVSIDRFTGGAIDSALFNEKTLSDEREYEIEILLKKNIQKEFTDAFEKALTDITTGMLSLGGATTKGHGIFTGTWSKK